MDALFVILIALALVAIIIACSEQREGQVDWAIQKVLARPKSEGGLYQVTKDNPKKAFGDLSKYK